MLNRRTFKKDELGLCKWQYSIRHENCSNFAVDDRVFLKSNPEIPMIVIGFSDGKVSCYWENKFDVGIIEDFPPQCILHYKHAGLLESSRNKIVKVTISLN